MILINQDLERIAEIYEKTQQSGDCLLWTGRKSIYGYPRAKETIDGRQKDYMVHRRVFSLINNISLTKEIHICHSCDTPLCINVNHLFIGDQKANMQDMYSKHRDRNQKKTHCKNGHEFLGENLLIRQGARQCRICTNARFRVAHKKRAAAYERS